MFYQKMEKEIHNFKEVKHGKIYSQKTDPQIC